MKRVNQGVSWTGAVKLGLFTPTLKKAINGKIEIPRIYYFDDYKSSSRKYFETFPRVL